MFDRSTNPSSCRRRMKKKKGKKMIDPSALTLCQFSLHRIASASLENEKNTNFSRRRATDARVARE